MLENQLLRASKLLGSQETLARRIGVSPQRLNAWLNKGVEIPYQYAQAIERETGGKVTAKMLDPEKAHIARSNLRHEPSTLWCSKQIAMTMIQFHPTQQSVIDVSTLALADAIKQPDALRPIGVDSQHQLIFGELTFRVSQLLNKKKLLAYVIDLPALLKESAAGTLSLQAFMLTERAAMGIALERLIGYQHGGNRRKTSIQVKNFTLEPHQRTRDRVAYTVGFTNSTSYEHAKKVFKYGIPALINAVDEQQLAVSLAAAVTHLPPDQQQALLRHPKKEIIQLLKQLKAKQTITL